MSYPQVDWNNSQYHREMRSTSPNIEGLKRPTGWIVVTSGDSTDPAYMYVAINDTGSWQRVDADTGTLGL